MIVLTAPRSVEEKLSSITTFFEESNDHTTLIAAFRRALPENYEIYHIFVQRELLGAESDSSERLAQLISVYGINNQGSDLGQDNIKVWADLRFRSQSEVRIAEALDKAGVLFLPNCKARLGSEKARANKEADFLVCLNGKWGILEVDGEPFHPPSRTVHDHERDRLFRTHGILVVEHFDAKPCFEHPDLVVKRFLDILEKA